MRSPCATRDLIMANLRPLGKTGLAVSALGFGAGPLGDSALSEVDAQYMLAALASLGVCVIDTAPSYGDSEARIGRAFAARGSLTRADTILMTKGGYGVPGVADWTPAVIDQGIDLVLRRLQTDYVDVFLLHSCPLDTLTRGDLFAALQRAKYAGKVRAVGYAGDGAALAWAIESGHFDVVECSVNLVDQRALATAIPSAVARGVGVVAKRALASAAWLAGGGRDGVDGVYPTRMRTAFPASLAGLAFDELALRYAAFAPGVGTALMGTRSRDRFAQAAAQVERGPLPLTVQAEIADRFARHGADWHGMI
jgi:aryl-alcohol dehydrogenase-like predicted oxidoreductase